MTDRRQSCTFCKQTMAAAERLKAEYDAAVQDRHDFEEQLEEVREALAARDGELTDAVTSLDTLQKKHANVCQTVDELVKASHDARNLVADELHELSTMLQDHQVLVKVAGVLLKEYRAHNNFAYPSSVASAMDGLRTAFMALAGADAKTQRLKPEDLQ